MDKEQIEQLNSLMLEGEQRLEILDRKHRTEEKWQQLIERYIDWYKRCLEVLSSDLRMYFEEEYQYLIKKPDPNNPETLRIAELAPRILKEQQRQLFLARRRLWKTQSPYPNVRNAIAKVCRSSYKLNSIERLFVDAGCEQDWYIPTTEPDSRAQTENAAFGWLDGILFYAPDREGELLSSICKRILTKKGLKEEDYQRITFALQQLEAPQPADELAEYNLHPKVYAAAAKLISNQHYDEAILKVCIELDIKVKRLTDIQDDGTKLMQQAFSQKTPKLRLSEDDNEQLGWMQLYVGAIQALRNPRAHKNNLNTSREETIEWLHFLSALFRQLDSFKPAAGTP